MTAHKKTSQSLKKLYPLRRPKTECDALKQSLVDLLRMSKPRWVAKRLTVSLSQQQLQNIERYCQTNGCKSNDLFQWMAQNLELLEATFNTMPGKPSALEHNQL